jgi:Tfp pilus assembly protein PilO
MSTMNEKMARIPVGIYYEYTIDGSYSEISEFHCEFSTDLNEIISMKNAKMKEMREKYPKRNFKVEIYKMSKPKYGVHQMVSEIMSGFEW